ncbi:MAG: EamA family transporter [Pseudolabrys sp.]|nr:EamA family transporter [Pseudolabrys sp.]MBV9954129.1 EamA family transporter [Pseudolabrys sp.]
MNPSRSQPDSAAGAKVLVLLLAFAWGFNWIAAAFALQEVTPWSLRFAGSALGAGVLFAVAFLSGYDLHVPRKERIHVAVAGFFNVAAFQLLAGFAQLSGATSRAIIITYSMPIWATLLSRFLLGEKLNAIRWIAFALCVLGVSTLIWPLLTNGVPISAVLSLGCAFSWAFATVYMKWVKATVQPLANAAWQLLFGLLFLTIGVFVVEGYPHLWPIKGITIGSILFVGIFGVGLAHFLWWAIVNKLPTVTASIGSLLVPVVGVTASTILLGERPTLTDAIGFTMIFAAAACVLLQRDRPPTEMPE